MNTNLERSHRFNTITAIKPKDFAVFNLGKRDFQPATFFVIGAKAGKLLCVRERSKSVHVGFGIAKKELKVVEVRVSLRLLNRIVLLGSGLSKNVQEKERHTPMY